MSLAISAVSKKNTAQVEQEASQQAAPKLTANAQIKLLAEQGHSTNQIAQTVGLPTDIVALTLGDTTPASSAISSASALVALSGRLSLYA